MNSIRSNFLNGSCTLPWNLYIIIPNASKLNETLSLCWIKHHDMKAPFILNFTTKQVHMGNFMPHLCYPRRKRSLYQDAGKVPEPVWTHWRTEKSPLPNGNKTMNRYHQLHVLSLYWLCYPSSWVTSRRNLHVIFSSWKVGIISDQNEPQLNFSHTSFGENPHTTRLNNNQHNSFRNKTCRQTNTPSSLCINTI